MRDAIQRARGAAGLSVRRSRRTRTQLGWSAAQIRGASGWVVGEATRRLHELDALPLGHVAQSLWPRHTRRRRTAPAGARGTRFPFHDRLLVSATAQLGLGLLRLGMEIPLLARLAETVRSAVGPSGAWHDAEEPEDVMTTLVCAELPKWFAILP